ncbi:hypothetical protein A4A49_30604 [Nicotiana attenuata]|uniref:RRM domain-containing protein n=1 Tax=Nicotiana attenuata TaxID=49451 RepID=A0A1J6IIR4_NICAT|nr:hypothetical protein A4A49_30604 [Nicotiana attenuata]
MGAKAKKKAITKKLKKRASDFSASSASKHEAHDFLPLEGGPAQKLPKTEVRENKATVLYIGRIPHGFYENEMEGFFKQFGTIKRLRIARNKKTGKSMHFGFTEFESPEVAKVVGILCIIIYCLSTYCKFILFLLNMYIQDCYFGLRIGRLWKGVNRWYKPLDWVKIEKKRQDKERTLDEHKKLVEGILKCDKKRRKRIEAAGIDYECPEIVGSIQAAPKKIRFDAELIYPAEPRQQVDKYMRGSLHHDSRSSMARQRKKLPSPSGGKDNEVSIVTPAQVQTGRWLTGMSSAPTLFHNPTQGEKIDGTIVTPDTGIQQELMPMTFGSFLPQKFQPIVEEIESEGGKSGEKPTVKESTEAVHRRLNFSATGNIAQPTREIENKEEIGSKEAVPTRYHNRSSQKDSVNIQTSRGIINQQIEYEWKPKFCCDCVRFGHNSKDCWLKQKQEGSEEIRKQPQKRKNNKKQNLKWIPKVNREEDDESAGEQTEKMIHSIPLSNGMETGVLKQNSATEGTQGVIVEVEGTKYMEHRTSNKGKAVENAIGFISANRFDVLQMNETQTLQGDAGPSSFT